MKCVRCGHESNYSDRANKKCPKCKGAFAFEPKAGDPFTDVAFQSAIDAVSAKGQVRWGAEHLYYELARRQRAKFGCAIVAMIVFAVIALITLLRAGFFALAPALIVVALALFVWRGKRNPFVKLEQKRFDTLFKTWRQAHGQPKGLIVRAMTRGTPAPQRALEADIADYSFDHAVICDRARTADLLLANNFHFENNCAVLSVDGYPEAQFETVRAMLKRNPRLRVFALHDATPKGCRLAHTLASDSAWFAGQATVIDVGLRPRQARAFRGLFLPPGAARAQAGSGVSASDSAWLSAQALELAVIRPEQVLKRLYKAMTREDSSGDGGGSGEVSGSSSSGGGSDSSTTDAGFAGGGGTSGDSGASVRYDDSSFAHEAGDTESDSDGFG